MTENKLVADQIVGRRDSRSELLRIARDYSQAITDVTASDHAPENIIATGHQAIWHHCGIWAKNLTACKFARAVDGASLHLVLDHDVCDTALALPKPDPDGNWHSERIELEPEQGASPLEFRCPPRQDHIRAFIETVAKTRSGRFCGDIWSQDRVLNAEGMSCCNSVADLITRLQSVLNVALGLDMMYLPVSKLSESEAFLAFVTSIVLDAADFACAYNEALTNMSSKSKVKQRCGARPLRLGKIAGLSQLPFWLHMPGGRRMPLCVASYKSDRITIGTALAALGELDSTSPTGKANQLRDILNKSGYCLRPKAVSLTLFVRLYLADWFVHGIGGNLYEPVTDYVIENYYRIRPLRFGTSTCTMTLPLSNSTVRPPDDISQLKHMLHDIGHNPEKYMDNSLLQDEAIVSLLQAKTKTVALAGNRSAPANVRKSAWNSLLRINQSLSEYTRNTAGIMERKIAKCAKSKASQEVCDCREYFFGLFQEDRLRKLAESLTFCEPK